MLRSPASALVRLIAAFVIFAVTLGACCSLRTGVVERASTALPSPNDAPVPVSPRRRVEAQP